MWCEVMRIFIHRAKENLALGRWLWCHAWKGGPTVSPSKARSRGLEKETDFFRAMLPGEQYEDRSTGFFVLLVKRDTLLKEMSDEDYRRFRANLSYGYALNILRKVPYLERVVGIATEGEIRRSHRSEDLIYAERPEWTTERIEEVETLSEKMNILQGDALSPDKLFHIRPFEYPPSHHKGTREQSPLYSYRSEPETVRGNRRERRAARAKSRSSN